MSTQKDITKKVSEYYTNKIKEHGISSQGVDWNSKESQFLRFEQLCKILPADKTTSFTILDYGCGYGALIEYLMQHYDNFKYIGYDVSDEMINKAKSLFKSEKYLFTNDENKLNKADYVVASGIFNVKLDTSKEDWKEYILNTLNKLNELSSVAFSFNILTSYSDAEYMRDHLYYADPLFYFDYCKRHFSRNVALLHDYGLYEFTILVRK
ncbi:cyclopropane fatty-acyl-phospholipid synthase-like methyltransferase [Thermonema lapsum]|uniref:Cyclopropane fatty-acyl-phospholipid synthase-like methyltransferase n=1 Tax=Thermonema lapsum TaxID=28195 RepID=A0A846MM40_9BACT|nr:class I SAM-dependent methyltransferase [Thermonema lapsum]NIK72515.1 cyclopropane fatty-acyl-phospholipid synthase-like methyltransferase [Thermonema lapsum]